MGATALATAERARGSGGCVLILGIETATEQVGCALGDHQGPLSTAHALGSRRHAETLAPQIEFICETADVSLQQVAAVAIDIGPGLFTGLRVGIASAVSIASALSVPVVAVPSLDLVAFHARYSPKLIVAVLDARRGEIFTARYRSVPGGVQRVGEYRVQRPEELAVELAASRDEALLVGDGALRYRDALSDDRLTFADPSFAHPRADALVELAHARALREEFIQPFEVEPLYLRLPDAQVNWTTRNDESAS